MNAPAPKVCFLYIAQTHQILHSLPIAIELARNWPQFDVHLAATSQAHLDYIDEALAQLGDAPLTTRLLGPSTPTGTSPIRVPRCISRYWSS